MTTRPDPAAPLSRSAYRRALAPDLDLRPRPGDRLVALHLLAHVGLALGLGALAAAKAATWPLSALALLALPAGHSLMVAAFAAHELGHGAARFPKPVRALLVQLGWTFAIFATPTTQHHAHNQRHHKLTNTPRDPDRRLTLEELRVAKADGVAPWLFPNGAHPIPGALVGFAMSVFGYHTSLFWHSVLRTGELYDLELTDRARRRAIAEACFNGGVQLALFAASGFAGGMALYLALTYWVGASLAGAYIATNHLLCGLSDEAEQDELAAGVSLRMPEWLDRLHLRFSHHVEHHLFPGAAHGALPAVRAALEARFPERFQTLTWGEALRRLLRAPLAVADKNTLAHPDGSGARRVDFPSRDEGPFEPALTPTLLRARREAARAPDAEREPEPEVA